MTILIAILAGILLGFGVTYLALKSRIEGYGELQAKYERLTDRDPKTGRFWKGPGV